MKTQLRFAGLCLLILPLYIASCSLKGEETDNPKSLRAITIAGPLTAFDWPMYIAKEGGYYRKYGLDVKIVFVNHPEDVAMLVSGEAQVTLTTLQQAMQLSPMHSTVVIYGTPLNRWLFALIAQKEITSVPELKNKRVGVTQIGGSTYDYAVRLLAKFGLSKDQVKWISVGSSSRAAALAGRHVDATMLSAPSYFPMERAGYRTLANIADFPDIPVPNVMLIERSTLMSNPLLPELLMKAHAEAVKRFYEDKYFAVKAYQLYDKQDTSDLNLVYDSYVNLNAFARIPYLMTDAVRFMIDTAPDTRLAADMSKFDYRTVIDNALADHLVSEHVFEQLFGLAANIELKQKNAGVFR